MNLYFYLQFNQFTKSYKLLWVFKIVYLGLPGYTITSPANRDNFISSNVYNDYITLAGFSKTMLNNDNDRYPCLVHRIIFSIPYLYDICCWLLVNSQ